MMNKRVIAAVAVMVGGSAMASLYTTSFDAGEGFTSGDLNGQNNWFAQTQWKADGAGNAYNSNGAFVRAHNTDVLGTTAIGEVMTITSVITLGAYSTPSGDIASFEENIFQQGMSHQQGVANFGYGLAAGVSYSVATGNIELRAGQGTVLSGTSVQTVGAASGLGGTTYTLTTAFTKTAANTWNVAVSLNDGVNPAWMLAYSANSALAGLDTDSDGGGILGGFQANPSSGGSAGVATAPFGSTTVSAYSLQVIPEPATLGLVAAFGGTVLFIRRRFMM